MPRLFVAIDLPKALQTKLSAICRGIPGTRWLPPNQLHLTLKFVGDVDDTLFHTIRDNLSGNGLAPTNCFLRGIGCFPAKGRPRVIWAGVKEEEYGLTALQRRIEKDLEKRGVPLENRPFTPHITLARLKDPPRETVSAFLSRNAEFDGGRFTVNEFHLYSSNLTPRGAIHTLERSYPCQLSAMQINGT